VSIQPVNQVYYFQDNATFICSFLGGLGNVIEWAKDGSVIAGEQSPMLSLRNISSDDGGSYSCTVMNSAGNETSSTMLYVAPYFIVHPEDVEAERGDIVSMSCLARAFPLPLYQWVFNSLQDVRVGAIGTSTSTFSYNGTMFGDEGPYSCEATIFNLTVTSNLAILTCKSYN